MRIVCAGEVMAELCGEGGAFVVGFAGDSFNTAVYCRRAIGSAGVIDYVTRIGTEGLSDGFLRLADAERMIGIYAVDTDARGERRFSYWRDRSAARRLFSEAGDLGALDGADLVFLSGVTLAVIAPEARARVLARIAELRADGTLFAFDSNYRPTLWEDAATAREVIGAAWRLADVALPSVDDETALFGGDEAAVLDRLRAAGCWTGALKRGATGPVAINPAAAVSEEYIPAEQVVDTTAAGDSFNGAYLAALVQGQTEAQRLRLGHEMARYVVTRRGAVVERQAR